MRISIYHPSSLAYDNLRPSATETGIAGSEETLINYCRELAKFQVQATVYTQYEGHNIEWEGGIWKSQHLFEHEQHILVLSWSDDVVVLRRIRNIIGFNTPLLCRFVNQKKQTEFDELYDLVDIILSQSDWLISKYTNRMNRKVRIVKNGIGIVPDFDREFCYKNAIYASDYDRGLVHVLQRWPEIKKIRPDLELSVCYGWEIFQKKAELGGWSKDAKHFIDYVEMLLIQPGIIHLGRIGHNELFKLITRSDYWLYPCTFPENCSTLSLKMQAYGALPIVVPSGGLDETVKYGFKTNGRLWEQSVVPSPTEIASVFSEWDEILVEALIQKKMSRFDRLEMMSNTYDEYSYAKVVSNLARAIFECVA